MRIIPKQCKKSPSGQHQWTRHVETTKDPKTGEKFTHTIIHCQHCGKISSTHAR